MTYIEGCSVYKKVPSRIVYVSKGYILLLFHDIHFSSAGDMAFFLNYNRNVKFGIK
jgi:hypothetical protein